VLQEKFPDIYTRQGSGFTPEPNTGGGNSGNYATPKNFASVTSNYSSSNMREGGNAGGSSKDIKNTPNNQKNSFKDINIGIAEQNQINQSKDANSSKYVGKG